MSRGLRAIIGLSLSLSLMAAALAGCSSHSTPIGTVADSGFRPPTNGMPFQNYGASLSDGETPLNLTPADVQKMFGDSVCADANLRRCDLIPEAQTWLSDTNMAMSGGHCFGLAVLSELMWQGKVSASTLGATSTSNLVIDDNDSLQRSIAYNWALQTLESVQSGRVTGSPNQILDKLEEVLKPHPSQTYTLTFWKRDGSGGHAVTPYEVNNKGDGKVDVLIYDNNWPGKTRAIAFDTKADTWTYDAASNPNEPESAYEGDADTKTLSLSPTAPGLGVQKCPFCAKEPSNGAAKAGNNTEQISLVGSNSEHANLIISDDAGRQLGYIDGNLVNQIPGGRVEQIISGSDWTNNMSPNFFLPADVKYTITLDGKTLATPDTERLSITGPSYDLVVDKIRIEPGDKNTVVIEPDATQVSYTSTRQETPAFTLGVSNNQADYSFDIGSWAEQPGHTLNFGLPPEEGVLKLQDVGGSSSAKLNVKVSRMSEQGVQVFAHDAIPLSGDDLADLQFGSWNGSGQGMALVTTHDGQESTQTLLNEQSS